MRWPQIASKTSLGLGFHEYWTKKLAKICCLLWKNLMFNFSTSFQFQHRPLYIHGVDRNFLLWQRMYKWCWNCKINSLISNGRVVKALNFNVILYMMNTSLIFAGIMQMSDYFYPLPCGQVGRVPGTTVLLSWVTRFDPTRGNMKFSLVKTNNKVRLG